MSIHNDKIDAVAMCYVTARQDGLDHNSAEDHCYKMAENMQIDSYQLREGVVAGRKMYEST
jgi:hypothetical protein